MQPLHSLVLVKPIQGRSVTKGGILVPTELAERSNKATVIAVGRGTKDNPMKFQVGDKVFNIKDCGNEFIIDGEKHYLIESMDILAYQRN
jgi:chaperonin GroES